jgi:hypothetical protein
LRSRTHLEEEGRVPDVDGITRLEQARRFTREALLIDKGATHTTQVGDTIALPL